MKFLCKVPHIIAQSSHEWFPMVFWKWIFSKLIFNLFSFFLQTFGTEPHQRGSTQGLRRIQATAENVSVTLLLHRSIRKWRHTKCLCNEKCNRNLLYRDILWKNFLNVLIFSQRQLRFTCVTFYSIRSICKWRHTKCLCYE